MGRVILFTMVLASASPLLAHHAWPVDRTRQVTITGTVTAFTWASIRT